MAANVPLIRFYMGDGSRVSRINPLEVKKGTLENSTLDLGNLLQINVSDHQSPDNRETHDSSSGRQHSCLRVRIGLLDGESGRGSDSVGDLSVEALVDISDVGHGRLRESGFKGSVEGVGPDGTGNGGTSSTADGSNDIEKSKSSSDVLVVNGSQNCELLDNDEDGSTDGDENLTHHEVTDGLVGATEIDHQSLGEDVQGNGNVENPLEAASAADQESNTDQQDTRDDIKGVADVSCLGNSEVVDNLQERGVVMVPAVVGDLVCGVEQACANDSAVRQDAEVEQRRRSELEFPSNEDTEHNETDNDHGNDVVRAPAIGGR